MRYEPGVVIAGKYQLSEQLGEGGMGWVFGAQNLTLGVPVAIKLMRSDLARETHGLTERMLQEAQAAASLGHPSIIRVLDFGFTECADPFIVMEWLHGESLSRLLYRRGALRPSRAVQILLPIIDALAEAHEADIVHRDIKPENIFLARPAGQRVLPKLLDFGIAKWIRRASERLTREGTILGSPAYMAPEQVRGETDIDGRVDQWAVCVVLYEMLTRHRPFEAENYHAEMWSILSNDPRPFSAYGVNEPALWTIVQRGLSKERADRYPNLRALWAALSAWLTAHKAARHAVVPEVPDQVSLEYRENPQLAASDARLFGLRNSNAAALFTPLASSQRSERSSFVGRAHASKSRRWWWAALCLGVFLLGIAVTLLTAGRGADRHGGGLDEDTMDEPEPSDTRRPEAQRKPRSYRAVAPLPTTGPHAPLLYVEPRPSSKPAQPSRDPVVAPLLE